MMSTPESKPSAMYTCLRLEPEKRLCARFDADAIALFPTGEPDEMGMRVLDNVCEDHIQ